MKISKIAMIVLFKKDVHAYLNYDLEEDKDHNDSEVNTTS